MIWFLLFRYLFRYAFELNNRDPEGLWLYTPQNTLLGHTVVAEVFGDCRQKGGKDFLPITLLLGIWSAKVQISRRFVE